MLFEHPAHPGRAVRLAYCLNLHPAQDLDGVLAGMREITLPLADRLTDPEARRADEGGFGVGLWLPASVAGELATPAGQAELERLATFLADHGLDAFTYNAFPYGGFHDHGLKESVFRPTWQAPERLAFTLAVAQVAVRAREAWLERARRAGVRRRTAARHLSISTHAGGFGAWVGDTLDLDACADNLGLAALHLARLESDTGRRIVLSLEPEPRSSANDTTELADLHARVHARARDVLARGLDAVDQVAGDIVRRHVGTCLDACHAAVEFEPPDRALASATPSGTPLGKLQFSSALSLPDPDAHPAGRDLLLALDEPVYLHQVTARRGDALTRASDLADVAAAVERADPAWRASDEWRCHFHVPVDLARLDAPPSDDGDDTGGLRTTRAQADELLAHTLASPERWGTAELHLEIETYTWTVLPASARGTGSLVDGLEREYAHVIALLASHGWTRPRTKFPPGRS